MTYCDGSLDTGSWLLVSYSSKPTHAIVSAIYRMILSLKIYVVGLFVIKFLMKSNQSLDNVTNNNIQPTCQLVVVCQRLWLQSTALRYSMQLTLLVLTVDAGLFLTATEAASLYMATEAAVAALAAERASASLYP